MPTDRRSERSALRGLLIPDTTLVFDESQSTLTQAGPRAGLPEPARRTTTALVATGDQTEAFTVEVERGGTLGGTIQLGARVTYAHDGETYGWDQPVAIRGWELVREGSTTEAVRAVCAIRDEILLVAIAGTSGTSSALRVMRKAHEGNWTSAKNWPGITDTSGGGSVHACFVPLPTGRIMLFHTNWDLTDGATIRHAFSDDDGVTWSDRTLVAIDEVLAVNVPALSVTGYSDCLGMAAAYLDGDISLFLSTRRAKVDMGSNVSRDGLIQFASSDLGQSFKLVDESDYSASSWNGGVLGSLVSTHHGQLLLTFVSAASSPSLAKVCRLGSAFTPFTDFGDEDLGSGLFCGATTAAPSSGVQMADWDLCACVMDDGRLWAYTRDGEVLSPAFSENGGVDWDIVRNLAGNVAFVYDSGTSDSYLKGSKVCAYRHAVVLAHNWAADSGPYTDLGTAVAYLGGYANMVHGGSAPDRWSWMLPWVPLDLPNDVGWTGSGGGIATLSAGDLGIVTTFVQSRDYTRSFSEPCVDVRASLAVAVGTASPKTVYVSCVVQDAGSIYEVEVRIGTTGIVVRDVAGFTTIGTASIDATAGIDILIMNRRGLITVLVGPRTLSGETTYDAVVEDDFLTPVASASTSSVSWGQTGEATSTWYELHVSEGDETTFGITTTPGASLSLSPVYTAFGTYIKAEGGPAWTGDSWTIAPRYDFGIDRVDPVESPSPRRGWRSTTDADDVYLAFKSDVVGGEHQWGGQLIAFGFFNVNWSVGEIQTRSIAGTWSTLFDFSSSQPGLTQLAYARHGSTLVPTSSTGGNPFLRLNELAGSSIYLASGFVCRIVSNTAGRWSTASGAVRPTITIDASALGALDALSGSSASIVPKDFVVITRVPTTAIRGVRVYVEAGDTPEGHFQIGTLVIGHCEVFADEYGWGRNIDLEQSVERTTLRGGSTRTRVLAPPKRRITFSWEDGIDTTQIEGTEPEPDYVTSSSTASSPAVASMGHAPWQVFGLTSFLDSGRVPVVYLPSIPLGSTGVDTHTLNRRDQLMLAQVVSDVGLGAIIGDECEDEVLRSASVELEEVV